MSLLVVLASTSLALLVRILCESQQVQLTRLCMVILLTLLIFLLGSLHFGIQSFLLYQLQEDFNMSLHYFKTGMVLLTAVPPIICFFVDSIKHLRQGRLALKLTLLRALDNTAEVKKSGGSLPQETREGTVVSCSNSVLTRVQRSST